MSRNLFNVSECSCLISLRIRAYQTPFLNTETQTQDQRKGMGTGLETLKPRQAKREYMVWETTGLDESRS